jgi:hypothetical protein
MDFLIDAELPKNKEELTKLLDKLEEDAKFRRTRECKITFIACYVFSAATINSVIWFSHLPDNQYNALRGAYSILAAVASWLIAKTVSELTDDGFFSPRMKRTLDEIKQHRTVTARYVGDGHKPEGIL